MQLYKVFERSRRSPKSGKYKYGVTYCFSYPEESSTQIGLMVKLKRVSEREDGVIPMLQRNDHYLGISYDKYDFRTSETLQALSREDLP